MSRAMTFSAPFLCLNLCHSPSYVQKSCHDCTCHVFCPYRELYGPFREIGLLGHVRCHVVQHDFNIYGAMSCHILHQYVFMSCMLGSAVFSLPAYTLLIYSFMSSLRLALFCVCNYFGIADADNF